MNFAYVAHCILFSMCSALLPPSDPSIVSRQEWGANPPKLKDPMPNPVPFVVIHHSYEPAVCYDKEECITAMKWMQDFHQNDRGWNDIGYSFAVGGDGRIYEGRGWSTVGAHAPKYNDKSIGICVIGDWRYKLPEENQLYSVKELIKMGVNTGKIDRNYRLLGHRQVRDTECPGDALFAEIQNWPNFTNDTTFQPPSKSNLSNVEQYQTSTGSTSKTDLNRIPLDHQKPDIREEIESNLPDLS